MKSLKIAILLALLLPLSSNALTTHATPSHSFKSGFSSQKSAAPKSKSNFGSFAARPQPDAAPAAPAAPAASAAPRNGFGSFGNAQPANGTATAPADPRATSALSKDLDQRNANANALRTLDARNDARNGTGQPLPPLNNPVPGQRPQYGQQPYQQQPYPQQQPYYPQPVIVQQQSSGWGSMFMGFMLGRALSGGHHDNYYYQNGNGTNGGNNGNGANNGNGGNGAYPSGNVSDTASGSVANQSGAAVDNPQPAPKPSFAMSVLRIFLWLLILGCLAWLLYFGVRLLRGGKPSNAANYSFKRD
jgi:uncharacterized protein YgiB involved in biofilm formation